MHSAIEATELTQFMAQLLADKAVFLPTAIVIDVGQLSTGEWAVVEANAAWGAGIYGCEGAKVLEVLRHAAIEV